MRRLFASIASLAILAAAAGVRAESAPADETYEVKLHRPFVEGEVYDLDIERTIEIDTELQARTVSKNVKKGDTSVLKARMSVLAVDSVGQAVKIKLDIKQFTFGGKPLLPEGYSVEISREDKRTNFKAENKEKLQTKTAGTSTGALLVDLLPPIDDVGATSDDLFPAKTKRKAKEVWMLDADKYIQSLARQGNTVFNKSISGGALINEVRTVGNAKSLVVVSAYDAVFEKIARMPPGSKLISATGACSITRVIPLDPADRTFDEVEILRLDISRRHDVGMAGALDHLTSRWSIKMTPVKL